MADFQELQVSATTMQQLQALPDVADWLQSMENFDVRETLKASAVHTRVGDIVDPKRRLSYSRSGSSSAIFDFIDATLLPELGTKIEGNLRVYRGHYDFVYYSIGGFFGKHIDHVSAYGPGVCCWHVLLCLDAESCEGGATVLHLAEATHSSSATVTKGGLLAIRHGTAHEGTTVKLGRKVLLKFEVFQFEVRQSELPNVVRCCCSDGEVNVERHLLLRQPFFEKLDAFEGPREHLHLDGMTTADCLALRAYLLGGAALDEDEVNAAHGVIAYLAGPETALTSSEFAELCHHGVLRTHERRVAERLAALATESHDYVFLGLLHSWSVNVKDVWDLCIDGCTRQSFAASLCVVAAGHIVLSTWPGPRWRREQDSGYIFLPDLNKDVRLYDTKGLQPGDSFRCMDALLSEQVLAASAEISLIKKQPPTQAAAPLQPPLELSVAAGARLARLLLRTATRAEFKEILEASVGMARFRHEVYEDACNDGESYFTTTLYESRIFEFEWALVRRELLEGAP